MLIFTHITWDKNFFLIRHLKFITNDIFNTKNLFSIRFLGLKIYFKSLNRYTGIEIVKLFLFSGLQTKTKIIRILILLIF